MGAPAKRLPSPSDRFAFLKLNYGLSANSAIFLSLYHFTTQNMKIVRDILSPFALFSKERNPKLFSGSFRKEGRLCVCYH